MTAPEFSQLLLNQEAFLQQPFNALEKELEKYPYCQPLRFLLLKKDYLENGQASREKLNLASAYAADRAFLFQYLLPDESNTSQPVDAESGPLTTILGDKDTDSLAGHELETEEDLSLEEDQLSSQNDEGQSHVEDTNIITEEEQVSDESIFSPDLEDENNFEDKAEIDSIQIEESSSGESPEKEPEEPVEVAGEPDEIAVDLTVHEDLENISFDKQKIEGGIELLLEQWQKIISESDEDNSGQSLEPTDQPEGEALDIQSLEIEEFDENKVESQDLNLELDSEGNLDLSGAELSEDTEDTPSAEASDDADIKKKENKAEEEVIPASVKLSDPENGEFSPFLQWLESLSIPQNESLNTKPALPQKDLEDEKDEKDEGGSELEEVSSLAKSSVSEDHTAISETLASILAIQGNAEKAEEMYRLLSLKFPEKSTYFAGKIEKLKKS